MTKDEREVGDLAIREVCASTYTAFTHPLSWLEKARKFRRAVDLLLDAIDRDGAELKEWMDRCEAEPEVPHPYREDLLDPTLLLATLCLENLFKGLVLHEKPELSAGGRVAGVLQSHDLLQLAIAARVNLSSPERRLCRILHLLGTGRSRYPVPKKAAAFPAGGHIGPEFFAVFARLVSRLDSIYKVRCYEGKL